ncbi:MAG TPA: TA system VapC family ribonuclease toxin [Solirubrobacteraceae bacterium]
MALLDVNALVALAWDSHVHHAAMRAWFAAHRAGGWATCPVTESGFVRVSSNAKVLPSPIGVAAARGVLSALRALEGHRFLADDVSLADSDVPDIVGHRQVTDAHLLTLARRQRMALLTFDAAILTLAEGRDVELLAAL